MPRVPRRVVTGHNADGKSIFITDGPTRHVFQRSPGSAIVMELWETRSSPADNRGDETRYRSPFRLPPPKNGSVFRIIEYPPDAQRLTALAAERAAPDDGSGAARRWIAATRGTPASTRPGPSTTPSCCPAKSMR